MLQEFQHDLEADNLSPAEISERLARSRERIISAPVVIILSADMSSVDSSLGTRREKNEYIMMTQSVANAGLQLLLATHAEGLGGVWLCSPLFAQETVKAVLDLPKTWEPQAMFFLGYPDENPDARERKDIEEIVKMFDRSRD